MCASESNYKTNFICCLEFNLTRFIADVEMIGWSTLRLCCVRSFTVGRNCCYSSYVPTNHFILRRKPLNLRPKLSVYLVDVKCFAKFKAPKAKTGTENEKRDHWNIVYYGLGSAILLFGLSYCAVPAYRMFCTVIWKVLICVLSNEQLYNLFLYSGIRQRWIIIDHQKRKTRRFR